MRLEGLNVKIWFSQDNFKEYEEGIVGRKMIEKDFPELAREVVGLKVNGDLVDLHTPIKKDSRIEFVKIGDRGSEDIYRHTLSHVMAQAVKHLYPDARLGIGPTIENGFYYDFDIPDRISDDDLPKIEEEMKKIVEADLKIERVELPRDKAIDKLREMGEIYKVKLVEDMNDDTVFFYKQGDFLDLCKGPHMPSTGWVKHFKLLNVSGAYWRGDERNPMLQRIYATAFVTKSALEEYLKVMEEARKRDHRKLGVQLDLYSFHPDVAPGMVFFHPNGLIVKNELIRVWRAKHNEKGYQEVQTPLILNESLWRRSGHWDHYKNNMYFSKIDNTTYAVKPMNCPGHMMIYKSRIRSYKELPIKFSELGIVHRYEKGGVLHGLMRVRGFTQDDAHVFCTEEQIKEQIVEIIGIIDYLYGLFGFSYKMELSTMPEDHMGDEEAWNKATVELKAALDSTGREYVINEGEGAFYGPKIDFHIKDSIGRFWQCGTVQLDFLMPERFELTYIGADNMEHRPVMIHRALYGSLERFMAILVEHFGGAFPTWLAPIQVKILPIADRHFEYAHLISSNLKAEGIRAGVDIRDRKTSYKVREAQMEKIPYMAIVGDREITNNTVAIRLRSGEDIGPQPLDSFISKIKEEINTMSLTSVYEE
ncbi:MAG: threonine--tRNA ligase [Thermotogae bacterium]|nr:threonine--tRNA ligase [Thermotogota bacterium]